MNTLNYIAAVILMLFALAGAVLAAAGVGLMIHDAMELVS